MKFLKHYIGKEVWTPKGIGILIGPDPFAFTEFIHVKVFHERIDAKQLREGNNEMLQGRHFPFQFKENEIQPLVKSLSQIGSKEEALKILNHLFDTNATVEDFSFEMNLDDTDSTKDQIVFFLYKNFKDWNDTVFYMDYKFRVTKNNFTSFPPNLQTVFKYLLENDYDVLGLIPKGLGVTENSIDSDWIYEVQFSKNFKSKEKVQLI